MYVFPRFPYPQGRGILETRSAYPATVHLCITRLLHCLISYQWWQVHLQSLYQQQGCLPWCLQCCVHMWLQCIQRTWHFLHKPCATPGCSAVDGIDDCPDDGAVVRRRSINAATGWWTNSAPSGFKDSETRARGMCSRRGAQVAHQEGQKKSKRPNFIPPLSQLFGRSVLCACLRCSMVTSLLLVPFSSAQLQQSLTCLLLIETQCHLW